MDIVIEQLTHLRLNLDKIFKSIEESDYESEIGLVGPMISTKMAFMWLGKAKGIAGSANPYPSSTDASSRTIEAAVDQYEGDIIVNDDDIAFIKTLRGELDIIENSVRNGLMPYMHANRFFQKALENAWTHICEAKMFLGLALGEIRDRLTPEVVPTPSSTPSDEIPSMPLPPSDEPEPPVKPNAVLGEPSVDTVSKETEPVALPEVQPQESDTDQPNAVLPEPSVQPEPTIPGEGKPKTSKPKK